jgi:hypothetical protein
MNLVAQPPNQETVFASCFFCVCLGDDAEGKAFLPLSANQHTTGVEVAKTIAFGD